MKKAEHPFRFVTVSYLTRIGNQVAKTLGELRHGLETCSDASIFHHAFQSLERHHFLTEGFSNDFAQWALASLNRPDLAEQLAGPDVRGYTNLTEVRTDLLRMVDEYCHERPDEVVRVGFEPFYFCESVEVAIPPGSAVWTLTEFRRRLKNLNHDSFHYHFLVSRLRLGLRTNDFSQWFEYELAMPALARRTNGIDLYTNTIEGARKRLEEFVDQELAA